MRNGSASGSGLLATILAAFLFGALFVGALFVGFGPDLRAPIVWSNKTDTDEDEVVECLKRRESFETVHYMSANGYGSSTDTRAYNLAKDVSLHFGDLFQETERVVVRARRELTELEQEALRYCIPDSAVQN